MSNRLAASGNAARSPTASSITIVWKPWEHPSTAVARAQPLIVHPVMRRVSTRREMRRAARSVPKKQDAYFLHQGGLAGQLAQPLVNHHPLTPLYEPAVRRDLADPDAGLLELGVMGEVEKITRISAARAAPSNEIVACTWPSSSLASGDRTSVGPRIRSTTNRAGRSPKPTRRPKPFS